MAWWHKLFGETKFPEIKYQTRKAFTVKGRTFYEMDDLLNKPFERAVTCLTFYTEFNQRCDRDYLLKHAAATDKALRFIPGQPVDIASAITLNKNLADRLNWIMDPDLAYKLASVVYFDKEENPTVYDFKYNQDKIAFWKKEMSARQFFFSEPILKLVPFLKDYEENFESYLTVVEHLKAQHLKDISQVLSKN